jgi:FMN phosphatase YigB (HAD superfamily)
MKMNIVKTELDNLISLRDLAGKAEIISFDFFDTLFVRPLTDPEDVFDILGIKYRITDFREKRRQAQKEAFNQMLKEGRREISLDNIYNNFCGLDENKKKELKRAEYQLELDLIQLNPSMINFFNEMMELGKIVIITSDMYFENDFFLAVLEKFNIKQVPLYISSVKNATKRDFGELFDKIINDFSVNPNKILHIGDNEKADIIRPTEKGLLTWHYNSDVLSNKHTNQSLIGSITEGLYRNCSKETISNGAYDELGYKIQAPASLGFLNWIESQCRADEVNKLLFISRDGYFLEKYAKEYFRDRLPKFNYFMGSRIAFNLALINEQNFISFIPFLLSGAIGLAPDELMERIGVESPSDDVMSSLGISSGTIISEHNKDLMRNLLIAYKAEILKVCYMNRRGLFIYINELGIKPGDKIGIVDVGWSGSTQEAFVNIMKSFFEVDIIGYYFCLANTPERRQRDNRLNMKALISDNSVSHQIVDKLYKNRVLVELFFSAPHETVIGYNPRSNQVCPVTDAGRSQYKDHEKIILSLDRGFNIFIKQFYTFCKCIGVSFSPLLMVQPIIDLVSGETWKNEPLFNEIKDFDTWGSSRNRTLKFTDY